MRGVWLVGFSMTVLAACGSSGSGAGGGFGGAAGASGFTVDPPCTDGTFGLSGRFYYPQSGELMTRVFPLVNPVAGTNALDAALEGGGELHLTWTSATGNFGDSLTGALRVPPDASHAATDWCVDSASRLTIAGSSAALDLFLAPGACPPPPLPGEPPPPAPATLDHKACWDLGP
jgi:hypothetical protein